MIWWVRRRSGGGGGADNRAGNIEHHLKAARRSASERRLSAPHDSMKWHSRQAAERGSGGIWGAGRGGALGNSEGRGKAGREHEGSRM